MIFPPIFSLTLFFILDLLELVFDIFVITSSLGVFLSILSTIFYIIILLFKYGPNKTKERLFTFKKVPRTKAFKKIMKVFGASIIPFMTTWAVWDDYKEDLEEKSKKEIEAKEKKQELSLKQGVDSDVVAATTGRADTAAVGAEATDGTKIETKALASRVAVDRLAEAKAETAEANKNLWIKKTGKEISQKNISKEKTIFEEVGGGKTWTNKEDYDSEILDYSKTETYEKLKEDKKREKEEKDKQIQKEAQQKRIQGIKAEQNIREELLDRSKRRYGKDAKETERLEDKYRESLGEEK